MNVAVITLSPEGADLAGRLAASLPGVDVYIHENAVTPVQGVRFSRIIELTAQIFENYAGLVYITSCGVVVRAVGPLVQHKTVDPAVVVMDVGGRWAVSLLCGHEGRANDLAVKVANIVLAEPVISTTTEALKDLIVGIGCRRGTSAAAIVTAVQATLDEAQLPLNRVRLLASAELKADEEGLLEAAEKLDVPLRIVSSLEIRNTPIDFEHSDFVEEKVDLPAVAEPAALLAGRRTRLVVPKKKHHGITVAIAQESFLSGAPSEASDSGAD
ncbi:MAG: cobalamin biosynthesis protein [Deltaproteobacteria bacterium]|nr:cobalamin biosynthesis protein [Deltaproteobacteria bacterium]